MLRLSFGRAVIAWLIVNACGLLAMPIASFVVRPHVMEWYQASANSMAPAIVAWHADVTCPHCGGAAFAGMELPASRSFGTPETHNWAICSNCRQTSRHEVSGLALRAPDRIAVDKLAAPRRWDVVVQRAAYDPNVLHVFRLVGMPGESIEIKEGSVYANGEKLEPPPGIGLRYEMPENLPASAVSEFQTAWELGATEVITLGDNSRFSNDSRFQGPVLFSDLVGVVRWRCWPPDRWGNVR
ncbi:MAG: signal peptidase I [Pirellulales bacterium]